jgi:hypothetical protein
MAAATWSSADAIGLGLNPQLGFGGIGFANGGRVAARGSKEWPSEEETGGRSAVLVF